MQQPNETGTITAVLTERGKRYGSFKENANISQRLCEIIREHGDLRESYGQEPLTNYQQEALEMIAHKMARIISGDAYYDDNWIDISGYAQLGLSPR